MSSLPNALFAVPFALATALSITHSHSSVVDSRGAPVVREEVALPDRRGTEHWRLEWASVPAPICQAGSADATTCPCSGFAYGEMGELMLVRSRSHAPDEQLPLSPLFRGEENPANALGKTGEAVLQRWPVLAGDYDASDLTALARRSRTRQSVRVMNLRDYDHDGSATEFMLQVGTLPCGKRQAVVVGISRDRPILHAFTSVGHPERPLVLDVSIWNQLRRAKDRLTAIAWACGDHGADTRGDIHITLSPQGIDGRREEHECARSGGAGRLISSERL